ncbi:lipopolysaccharide biosynthesis protein [Bradyrhizobium sp. SSUT112]|uniref:lipopolysaccharide biosynthesis protein n=1 Tax=Bradyrhizobium sp. SSUT112 TaxID=3040604 RepID=UPI00244730E4|nr:lipopolysaccharide biosynthesis protein [Bradyrhizobium sp. SSUT112]MDH2355960.1 lipopolysaccharide biosynthesis protein [Bradyrhizobium sp. SSUT112]
MVDSVAGYFQDHSDSKDLGRRALRGGFVSVAMQYGNGALQIVSAVILARLLAPEDFGLVAIVTVLTSFAPLLIDFGLGDATVQRSKITRGQVNCLFWLSSGIGLAVALIVAACSPLIAWIYGEPRLAPIALCIAITFVLGGASNQHLALLRRSMQFGRIANIQILSTLAGIVVAVVVAIVGSGYWALVLRPVVSTFCIALGAWFVCRWRPGFPAFDSDVRPMIRFGQHVVGFSVIYTMAKSVDRIALGLFYRPDQVGYYQNAIALYENSIFAALIQLHMVASATLSKLQSDPAALRQKYEAALSALAFFVMPAASILSVVAEDLTVILLGEKWRMAGSLLSIIALRGIFQVVEGSQGWLHVSIGRPDRWRNWGIITAAVQVVAVLAGLRFGATGVAIAMSVTSLLIALPSIIYAGRPIGIGAERVIRAVGPQLIGAIGALAGGWWLRTEALGDCSSLVRILLLGGVCTCLYLAIVVGLFRLVEPIKVAGSIVHDLLKSR